VSEGLASGSSFFQLVIDFQRNLTKRSQKADTTVRPREIGLSVQ